MAKLFRSTSLRIQEQNEKPGKHSRNQSTFANSSRFYGLKNGDHKVNAASRPDPYARPSTSLDNYGRPASRLETRAEENWRFPKNTPSTWTAPRQVPTKPTQITTSGIEPASQVRKHTPTASVSSPQKTPSPTQRLPVAEVGPLSGNPVISPSRTGPSPVQPWPIQTNVAHKRQDSLFSPSSGKSPSSNPIKPRVELKEPVVEPQPVVPSRPKLSRWRSIGGLFGKKTNPSPTTGTATLYQQSANTGRGNATASWLNLSGRASALDMRPFTPQPVLQNESLISEKGRTEPKRAVAVPFSEYRNSPSPPTRIPNEPSNEQSFLDDSSDDDMSDIDSVDDASTTYHPLAEAPVLKVEIPSFEFERYSVMFNGILAPQRQSLLERRRASADRASSLAPLNTTNGLASRSSRSHRRTVSSPAASPSPKKASDQYPPRSSSRSSRHKTKVEPSVQRPRPTRQRSNTPLSKRSEYPHSTLDLVLESEEPPAEKDSIKRQRSRSSVTTASVSRPTTPMDGCSPLSMLQYSGGKRVDGWLAPTDMPAIGKAHSHFARISPAIAGVSTENLALALQSRLNSPTDTITTQDWRYTGELQVARSLSVTRATLQKPKVHVTGKAQTPVVRGSSGRRNRKSSKVHIEEA